MPTAIGNLGNLGNLKTNCQDCQYIKRSASRAMLGVGAFCERPPARADASPSLGRWPYKNFEIFLQTPKTIPYTARVGILGTIGH